MCIQRTPEDYIALVKAICYKLVRKWNVKRVSMDELESGGYMRLLEVWDRYDPSYGCTRLTFLYPYIYYGVLSEIYKLYNLNQPPEIDELKYIATKENEVFSITDIDFMDFIEYILYEATKLTALERYIVLERVQNEYSNVEIGETLGIDNAKVSRIYNDAIKKVIKQYNKELKKLGEV